jgi:hypothetical protein
VRFLRRNSTTTTETPIIEDMGVTDRTEKSLTPGKGRATPKRREAEAKRRGPVAPPPKTTREAMRRNKELRKTNPNPINKAERREAAKVRRDRMMAGDDKYLLPRDRGPVKAYVRDLVDSRRNLLGLFMPLAILVFVALLIPYPRIQQYATVLCTLMLLLMAVEGVLTGRRLSKQVREKFPKETIAGRSVGFYAFVRASQIRRLRVPKPRVGPGDAV